MSDRAKSALVSRREVTRILGGAFVLGAFGAGPALAQACAALPTVGQVRIGALDISINNTRFSACQKRQPTLPGLSVVVAAHTKSGKTACTLEVAGITIAADMTLVAVPGASNPYCGEFGFVQFTQYTYQRSPSGLGPGMAGGGYACARSSAWELDGAGPGQSYNRFVRCHLGPNKIHRKPNHKSMTDGPGVATEDAMTAYDMVWAGPVGTITAPILFRTWVIWETTDDSKQPSKINPLKRHPLARVDWAWQGQAGNNGPNSTCPSAAGHAGAGWDAKGNTGSVTAVLFGAAAGAPPTKFMRAHNNAWVPGQC
ncbi:MAG TPA: hypothetical protein VN823_00470 [Stellaceae bacterium]|nr:hypothetical protein [Stellaceae bacterium]